MPWRGLSRPPAEPVVKPYGCDFYLSKEIAGNKIYHCALENRNQFVQNGHLNMTLILQKYVTVFDELYGDQDHEFVEEAGRRYFLLFLKPVINGTGNCYVEARTRNMRRTDIIVDYLEFLT